MSRKSDRIWAQRSEAITLLVNNPTASAVEIVGYLFNSAPSAVKSEVALEARSVVDSIRRKREQEDAMLAAAQAEEKAANDKLLADAARITAEREAKIAADRAAADAQEQERKDAAAKFDATQKQVTPSVQQVRKQA